jgi:serine/threonine protein kinase
MLVAGELPFDGTSRVEVFEKIKSGQYKEPTRCSKECKDLITKMLCVNVDKRLTAE